MRRIAVSALILVSAGFFWAQAQAQTTLTPGRASTILTGANHLDITSTKIDTSRALRPPNASQAFATMRQPKSPALGNVFPKISLGSWPPKLPNVSILQGTNPFQPNPIRGVNPFAPKK
jgi:hypothetical protein